ncbi:autoinducer binding domain-containing protein [Aliihoeflea sp. 40Bstr573]|uniref:helix-turn-helix transcriptional regulator n=1 Tax=Aliihoeflea sp. 40Bstr573 TaxID=2696467 RepID=UPI00337F3155|nr:LuxR family transcriptional regulator [Aliihoeflea sp. 40Bstr573]
MIAPESIWSSLCAGHDGKKKFGFRKGATAPPQGKVVAQHHFGHILSFGTEFKRASAVRSLDETLQFVADLQAAHSIDAVQDKFLALSSHYGLDRVLVGTLPDSGLRPEAKKAHLLTYTWPEEWLDHYVNEDYFDCDPLAKVIRHDPRPAPWRGAGSMQGLSPRAQLMFDEASEFNIKQGLVLPIITLESDIVFVSLAGETLDIDPLEIGTLHLAASHTATRALQLSQIAIAQRARPELTARERECIRWAALGKSEWEISQILGISEHTSEKHLLSAKSKLGAVNRVQAVAEAIRLGYIT